MNEPLPEKDLLALVDRLLLEQGRLDPFELLLAAGLLAYQDYEAWRMGRMPDIQGALSAAPGEAAELLERAAAYARGQKLAATPLEHNGWGGLDQSLRIGTDTGLIRGCAAAFAPPDDRHQLDLFHDSSALLLEEEIRHTLAERRTDTAREQIARLMAQDPRHRHLRGFLRLIQIVDDAGSRTPKSRLRELEAVDPLARDLLGYRARDFLAPLWSDLAESLADRAFNPGSPRLHAGFAWARAGRWDADLELETEDFPAWLLLADPGTAVAVPAESAPSDDRGDAYALLHRLVRGDDAIAVRRALADTHPGLLQLFLSRRR